MTPNADSVAAFVERLKKTAPAWLDLLTANSDEEFEAAFLIVLQYAVKHMESNKRNFQELSETGLTGALAGALSIPDVIVARQEANCNGHVDLTLEAYCIPARTKLGEAKIYKSPSYHIKGISQLLGRYTTGRESSGLLLNYVREGDIEGITAKLRTAMDEQLPEGQTGPCENYQLEWSLVTKHKHSSGKSVSLGHIGFNLHIA